ncbi:acyltransferase domain-containing protein [Actinopolymorpha sp. NPDC004070]|uniref:acyltransferase domain-containing protein n=1 Tax=Actinopolymorpha sp. NPDC004070 TaxID=3154548 RepID=UPI0033AAD7AA
MCSGRSPRSSLDIDDVQQRLHLPEPTLRWLRTLHGGRDGSPRTALPDDDEADRLLTRLGVASIDRATTLRARPDPAAHPELWWIMGRLCDDLRSTMGTPPAGGGWPAFPQHTGSAGRHLLVWACLAVLPDVRRYHARHDVPDDISWASLAALGTEMASARRLTGAGGLDATWGMPRVFRGVTYRLGRLAFDRQRPRPEPPDHAVLRAGHSGLNTHVPADGGPLDPAACDTSFAMAVRFFPHRFPERVGAFGCHSWLMDEQLANYLPETSNIVRFQRRFRTFVDREQADWAPLENVFHRRYESDEVPPELLDELPRTTTLQRAVVTHLRRGGHWYNQTGWIPV